MRTFDPYHIYEFYDFKFSKNDLANIPRHRLGFMVASGLAANDQILFLKLYILSAHVPPKDAMIASIAGMNSTIYARNLIAKTLEYMSLYDKFHQKIVEVNDIEFRPFARAAIKEMKILRSSPLWGLIKKIRDKLTHHYDLDYVDPIETIKDFPDGHRFQALINEKSRNSFYCYAEEIGYLSDIHEKPEDGYTHDQLLEWTLDCSRLLLSLHENYMKKIYSVHFSEREVEVKRLFVSDELLWNLKSKIPILFSGEDKL